MELKLTREMLRFDHLAARGEEQIAIEGEATLPGSMRDAVTILSVQAQAHITGVQAAAGSAEIRGRVCFQTLYTQGDLTRIRSLETNCTFEHRMPLDGAAPGMRVHAEAYVQETEGTAGNGRMTLRALLNIRSEAFECVEKELVTAAEGERTALQTRMQTVHLHTGAAPCTGKTLVREEFDLQERLGVGEVLSASATAGADEFSGGNGRIGVSGTIEVRVLHRPAENGDALVTTVHEIPYEVSVDAVLPEGTQMSAEAEVTDVMADSAAKDRGRVLRVEAEVCVTLRFTRSEEKQLLEDLYSTEGEVLEPVFDQLDMISSEEKAVARESTRVQAALPANAPPIGRVVAAFSRPKLTGVRHGSKRLHAEGIMDITLIYLPSDSDIPYAVRTREPFFMTFPAEIGEEAEVYLHTIETGIGPSTSDRAELRCVLGMKAVCRKIAHVKAVTDVTSRPAEKLAHGFVVVWPQEGETRWETARNLRVPGDSLKPAGRRALMAFRK